MKTETGKNYYEALEGLVDALDFYREGAKWNDDLFYFEGRLTRTKTDHGRPVDAFLSRLERGPVLKKLHQRKRALMSAFHNPVLKPWSLTDRLRLPFIKTHVSEVTLDNGVILETKWKVIGDRTFLIEQNEYIPFPEHFSCGCKGMRLQKKK